MPHNNLAIHISSVVDAAKPFPGYKRALVRPALNIIIASPESEFLQFPRHLFHVRYVFLHRHCLCSASLPRWSRSGLPEVIAHSRFNFHSFDKACKLFE